MRAAHSLAAIALIGALAITSCNATTRELVGVTTTAHVATTSVSDATTSSTMSPSASTTPSPTTTATASTVSTPSTVAPTTTLAAGDPDSVLALDLLALIAVENEHTDGYDRDLFHYPKGMGGGCTTRTEVLRRDSVTPAQVDPFGCTVIAGDWWSIYDRTHHTDPTELDIDHVVALKEAWDSGAWRWDDSVRTAFANDFTDPRTLRAVTSAVNRDKSDKDPSNWLPPSPDDVCRYVGEWVAIKVRWGLSMDDSEFGRVRNLLTGQCVGTRVAPVDL